MPYEIEVTRAFSAAHQLRLPDGSWEPLHGHNWTVRVVVSADDLDDTGCVMDFHALAADVQRVICPLHNTHLNDAAPFRDQAPSTERVARHLAGALSLPAGVTLSSVTVWETPDCAATYRPCYRP